MTVFDYIFACIYHTQAKQISDANEALLSTIFFLSGPPVWIMIAVIVAVAEVTDTSIALPTAAKWAMVLALFSLVMFRIYRAYTSGDRATDVLAKFGVEQRSIVVPYLVALAYVLFVPLALIALLISIIR